MSAPLAAAVGERLGTGITLTGRLGGGSIATTWRARTAGGDEIVVKHQVDPPPGIFAAEAHGLEWLSDPTGAGPRVPAVLAVHDGDPAFIALEYVPPGGVRDDESVGRALAALHRRGAPGFGLDRSNLLATIGQDNTPEPTWADFLARRRLTPLRDLAAPQLAARSLAALDDLIARVADLVGPDEPPARLHGDLWSGNLLDGADGRPVVIDPAVYGGHREVDLAMMRLFGGFGPRVYAAYEETYPLAVGHEDRVALNQSIPLLVHVILFGSGYLGRLDACLRTARLR